MNKTVRSWLKIAKEKLSAAEITSARLDAELILSVVLKTERIKLHAFPERKLTKQQVFHANNLLNKRLKRYPMAYILGEKEFYGRTFKVSSDVLIPRPESESLIDLYKKFIQPNNTLLDVGTGSGILAITCALEAAKINLEISILASDIQQKILALAEKNAKNLGAEIEFFKSDLLENIPPEKLEAVNIIIANLPYVDRDWIDFSRENELHFEPQVALYSEENGLLLIKKLIHQTKNLPNLKYLILEADPEQHQKIIDFAEIYGFSHQETQGYGLVLAK